MVEIPVTKNVGSVAKFLQHIQNAGIPNNGVTMSYLKSAGFTSSNDQALPRLFRQLGFLDANSKPTERWKQYRDASQSKSVLATAIRECYSGLFGMYDDAFRKDDEAVANWMRSNTEFSGVTIDRAVRTFKTLCNEADFSSKQTPPNTQPQAASSVPHTAQTNPAVTIPTFSPTSGTAPSININVELHLPSTSDPKVFDSFFAAMKKHLFDES